MSDYISREAAIDAIDRTDWFHQAPNKNMVHGANSSEHQAWFKEQDVYAAIESIPAADVRTVRRGKWAKELHPHVRYNQYKCSICGEFSGHDSEGWIWKPNYCPNCGADMREEI